MVLHSEPENYSRTSWTRYAKNFYMKNLTTSNGYRLTADIRAIFANYIASQMLFFDHCWAKTVYKNSYHIYKDIYVTIPFFVSG